MRWSSHKNSVLHPVVLYPLCAAGPVNRHAKQHILGLDPGESLCSHWKHVVNELKQQVDDVRLCLSAISLTTCRPDNICKRCYTISRTSFTSSEPVPCNFMIFSKSARESHTLPRAKLLRQNSTGIASDCDLTMARARGWWDERSTDPLDNPARPYRPLPTVHATQTQDQN